MRDLSGCATGFGKSTVDTAMLCYWLATGMIAMIAMAQRQGGEEEELWN